MAIQGLIKSVVDPLMKGFGATEGSSRTESRSKLTEKQQSGLDYALDAYQDEGSYTSPGTYQGPSKSVDNLEGYRATDIQSLRRMQDEDKLSIAGIETLRNQRAQSASQVRPEISALRNLAQEASTPYEARLRQTVQDATQALGRAEIGDVRNRAGTGSLYGSARELAKTHMGENYARTVGEAAARAVEQSNLERMQIATGAYGTSGNIGLGAQNQRLLAARGMGDLEMGGMNLSYSDLRDRRNIADASSKFAANYGLAESAQSLLESNALNKWNMDSANMENTYRLNRLRGLTSAASVPTMENIVHKKPGSAGLLPGLISAGAGIWANSVLPGSGGIVAGLTNQAVQGSTTQGTGTVTPQNMNPADYNAWLLWQQQQMNPATSA